MAIRVHLRAGKVVLRGGKAVTGDCDCPCGEPDPPDPVYGDCTQPDQLALPNQLRFTFPASVTSAKVPLYIGAPPEDQCDLTLNCADFNGMEVILDRVEVDAEDECCVYYYGEFSYEGQCNTDCVDANFEPDITCDDDYNPDGTPPYYEYRPFGMWISVDITGTGPGMLDGTDGLVVFGISINHCPTSPVGVPTNCGPELACGGEPKPTSQTFSGTGLVNLADGSWTALTSTGGLGGCEWATLPDAGTLEAI